MRIALIAHDTKKTLMQHFATAYRSILEHHELVATGTTGQILRKVGLDVECTLAGSMGGAEIITSRISCEEIDVLFFFRDPITTKEHESRTDLDLLRVCDVHNVPIATNIATAEAVVMALGRGDLDYRIYDKGHAIKNL